MNLKFFIPDTAGDNDAESVYEGIRQFVQAPVQSRRLYKLEWRQNGRDMVCEVGKPLPGYFGLGEEPVLAIFDAGSCHMICTPSHGGSRGIPIIASHEGGSAATYFDS